jgi:hypothetical protein
MVPMGPTSKLGALFLAFLAAACSTASAAPSRPVVAASPPKDDGKSAQGGSGGERHSAALEQLRVAPLTAKSDKQASILVPLPDAEHWTRVRFLTLPSLVGFRYGKEHHAIVAGFVTHVEDNAAEGACNKSFEQWATPFIEAFEVEIRHDPPAAFSWSAPPLEPGAPKRIAIVDVDPVFAKTATILARESYHAAWAAYPAWAKACLVLGVAVPVRDDDARAREVRDRFLKEVFPKITVLRTTEPKERF